MSASAARPTVPPANAAYAPAFGPHGRLVVSGVNGLLALVDARSGRVLARLRGHRDLVFTPTTSAGGSIIASTGLDGTLRLWDARTARALGPPIRLGGPPTSDAGISPDGTRVAVSLAAGTVDVFDVRSHRRVARLRVDESNPTFSRFSRDGRYLLAGSKDGRIRAFTARDLRPLGPAFAAHDGSVSSVDASPDGRTLVSAGSDGQIRLWDIASRRPIGTPLPGPENINAVAFFAPDGAHVFADLPRRQRLPLGRPRACLGTQGMHDRRAPAHAAQSGTKHFPAAPTRRRAEHQPRSVPPRPAVANAASRTSTPVQGRAHGISASRSSRCLPEPPWERAQAPSLSQRGRRSSASPFGGTAPPRRKEQRRHGRRAHGGKRGRVGVALFWDGRVPCARVLSCHVRYQQAALRSLHRLVHHR